MLSFSSTRIRPITEAVIDEIVIQAGGKRAHPDHHIRAEPGADYVLGDAVIELKILEDEALSEPKRMRKLADIFVPLEPDRPVHVLDPELLGEAGRRKYDDAMSSPIRSAVRSARKQLRQSRIEYPDTTLSVLMIVNNGNTALNHSEIVNLVSRRARNDTDQIDGVIVAGLYLHSDGFESILLSNCEYVPINVSRNFADFDKLLSAFQAYATRTITASIRDAPSDEMTKSPVLDTGFEIDGFTFIKPAPPLGHKSDFYINGRPRLNSTGVDQSSTVGIIFPELDRSEWSKFRTYLPRESQLGESFEDWLAIREGALTQGQSLKPLVPVAITLHDWLESQNGIVPQNCFRSICSFANDTFQALTIKAIEMSRDVDETTIFPSRFILALTELIGQDEANDVSHILQVVQSPNSEPRETYLVKNARISHMQAITLGASYAVKLGIDSLLWKQDSTYAWV